MEIPNALLFLPPTTISGPVSKLVSPIVPLVTPHPWDLQQYLQERSGVQAHAITCPTVPETEERVRVCIHAHNTKEEVDKMLDGIRNWILSRTAAPSAQIQSNEVFAEARL